MLKKIALIASILVAALSAFAHEGHKHPILGTVTMLHENHLMVETKDGEEMTFVLTDKTTYKRGEQDAKREDLVKGVRVAIQVDEDGKTAISIKIGEAPSK